MQVLIILQARSNSTRLPKKVLKPILGKAMLAHQIARIQQATRFDQLLVATSALNDDNEIETLCQNLNIPCYRGSLNDVLDRYYQASKQYGAQNIVRITGDCPLIDSDIIDQIIDMHIGSDCDYTSNVEPPTLPDGLDVEVFTFKALERTWLEGIKPSEREHVTSFIRTNTHLFKCQNFTYKRDLSQLRWTVDEVEDFEFVSQIYQNLYPKNNNFNLNNILDLLEKKPELSAINQEFSRNEGLYKAQVKDKELGYD
ncbi:MAG: glycosyltransferase family protein [Colwellia sp.]|nr:glycosyltransferase family protein [Colwellia sp.]NQZ80637.1 glycosyltransferase family protein [Colwellia sp.]